MAMSVAENAPVAIERTPRSAQQQLALGSLLGGLYVLIGLWLVIAGLPLVWNAALYAADGKPFINDFLSATLLMMVCGLAAVGLGYVGYQLLRNREDRGLRTGIFFAAVMIFVSLWIGEATGNLLEEKLFDATIGVIVAGVLAAALLAGTVFLFLQPRWGQLLESADDQGWFHATAFKASQGIRVRRGTVVGVLTLGICGIYTLVTHRSFGYEAAGLDPNHWFWNIPFTPGDFFVPLM